MVELNRYVGTELAAVAEELGECYTEVFSAPPWNKNPAGTRQFRERLDADVRRDGFTAIVARGPDAAIDGFATGWLSEAPFRTDRAYGEVATQLGPERIASLVGTFEVDELAVRPGRQGHGLGRQLLGALVAAAPTDAAWLLTARRIEPTVAFYRRIGWHELLPSPGADNHILVFVSPTHPLAGGQ